MNAPNELSFLPDDYLDRKQRRRTNGICASLFMVVIVAIGSAFKFTEKALEEVEKQRAEVGVKFDEAATRIGQVQQMQEKQKTMAHQAELTASLLEKIPRSFLLAEVTNALPAGVSLLDLALDSRLRAEPSKTAFEARKAEVNGAAGVKAPVQLKLYDVQVKITGVATTNLQVAELLRRMNQSRLLSEVNLIISDEFVQNEEKMRKFQIEATLNPDAQVQPNSADPRTAIVELNTTK